MEAFLDRGYEQTTAGQIAARAGVTERTFFRHFRDKRDILFDGQEALLSAMLDAIAEAPADTSPMRLLRRAFLAVTPMFEENRAMSLRRQQIIAANPPLLEREAGKMASMTAALSTTLQERGLEAKLSTLAVQASAAAFNHALAAWLESASERLAPHLDEAFGRLSVLVASDPVSEGAT